MAIPMQHVRMRQRVKNGDPTLSRKPRRERITHVGVLEFVLVRAARRDHQGRVANMGNLSIAFRHKANHHSGCDLHGHRQ
jgi:hypothetical protein